MLYRFYFTQRIKTAGLLNDCGVDDKCLAVTKTSVTVNISQEAENGARQLTRIFSKYKAEGLSWGITYFGPPVQHGLQSAD